MFASSSKPKAKRSRAARAGKIRQFVNKHFQKQEKTTKMTGALVNAAATALRWFCVNRLTVPQYSPPYWQCSQGHLLLQMSRLSLRLLLLTRAAFEVIISQAKMNSLLIHFCDLIQGHRCEDRTRAMPKRLAKQDLLCLLYRKSSRQQKKSKRNN